MKLWILVALAGQAWACTIVEGDRILGAQFAAEVPAFASLDGAVDLGPAPQAGSRRVFRVFELGRIAQKYGLSAPTTEACFDRATQKLTEEALQHVLSAVIEDTKVEIVDYSKNSLPLGTLEFPRSGLDASGLWRGRLVYGENRSIPIWARVRVTNATSGEPIAEWHAATEPDVERGDTVLVRVASGGVLLGFEAPAESSGHVGEAVTVRNPANGKRFRAIVEAKGRVAVQP